MYSDKEGCICDYHWYTEGHNGWETISTLNSHDRLTSITERLNVTMWQVYTRRNVRERERENEEAPAAMRSRRIFDTHGVTFTGDVSDGSLFLVAVDTGP